MSREDHSPSPKIHDAAPAEGRRGAWREIALVFLVFFIVGGAPAPHVNESHYLTKAKHYWDASYCPGDFFLDSADPHLTFYWTLGWITRLCSLTATAWIGRLVAWAALAAAWVRLSRAAAPGPWLSVLAAAIWLALIEHGNFAGEWVVGGVEAKCFAYALVLAGLADMAAGRWQRPWIWFGAAAAFHVLVGAWAVIAGMAVWATEPRAYRTPLLKLLPGLVLGGLLSLPGLLPALALERGTDPAVAVDAAKIYVFERLPHHLSPLTLPVEELQLRLTRFGVVAAGFVALWAWSNRRLSAARRRSGPAGDAGGWLTLDRVMRFAGVALTCNCLGLGIEAVLSDRPDLAARILRYYWFRQADVAVPLAIALGGARLLATMIGERRRGGALVVVAVIAACGWFLGKTSCERIQLAAPPAANKIEDFPSWRAACEWIRDNSPPDSRALVPRTAQSFKWYASRADVANHKDVPQDATSVVEWRRRCRELFPVVTLGGADQTLGSPEQLGTARVRALARKYGAGYVVARSFPPLNLKVVYPPSGDVTGSFYAVYETSATATEGRP